MNEGLPGFFGQPDHAQVASVPRDTYITGALRPRPVSEPSEDGARRDFRPVRPATLRGMASLAKRENTPKNLDSYYLLAQAMSPARPC